MSTEQDTPHRKPVFETQRLMVRIATQADADLYYALWTDPRVMTYVGFPRGLRLDRQELEQRLSKQGESEFGHLLVVVLKDGGRAIGECWLGSPDEGGIAEPDVKLLPEFWGHKYGVEVWCKLVDYEFMHTNCKAVHGTPNVDNAASIQMQEAAGGVRIGEAVGTFPEEMRDFTVPVHYYTYQVTREGWERRRGI